ncbi:fibronectin type III domain-containing protein [Geobacter sp. SVR]|uniref:fibronectin type III domain-containing protein n=1 Tax=Geobacter sp. SVR TaxID=2495594 RepID=UPI00143EF49F|nr:fibronectin type III domain-containing protein [Geobacter sp. SVR]GCF84975.1 hypothetical protein GSbR_15750 [Geobacter sp. SVR]
MRKFKSFSILVLSLMVMMSTLVGCGGGGGGGGQSAASGISSNAGQPGDAGQPGAVSGATTKVVNLAWDPSTNQDGTPLSNLAGYKVHYGTTSGTYTSVVTVDQGNTAAVNISEPGTYYFVVTALDSDGNESGYSQEVSTVVS